MSRPPCYNRTPRASHYMANDGIDSGGRQRVKVIPSAFVDRCATHDGRGIGPNGETYPVAHGFDCNGCRWNPVEDSSVTTA